MCGQTKQDHTKKNNQQHGDENNNLHMYINTSRNTIKKLQTCK